MINGRTQKLERKMERNTFNCKKPLSNFCSKIMLLILLVPIFNMFCGSDDLRLKFIRVKEYGHIGCKLRFKSHLSDFLPLVFVLLFGSGIGSSGGSGNSTSMSFLPLTSTGSHCFRLNGCPQYPTSSSCLKHTLLTIS